MIQVERRQRRREARRDEFVAAASDLAAESGIEALTMKDLAARVDCAVGTAYSYFASKGALVAAVQAAAIRRLAAAYEAASPGIEPAIADLDGPQKALARLVAFGRFVVAADRVMPNDFRLQQQLLGSPVAMTPDDAAEVVPVAFDLLGRPQDLLVAAAEVGALPPVGETVPTFERAVSWVAAVNGVLSLDSIQVPAAGLFDTTAMADRVSLDLITAWGADGDALARASAAVPTDLVRDLLAGVASATPAADPASRPSTEGLA